MIPRLVDVFARYALRDQTPTHGWIPDERETEMTEQTYTRADMARAWAEGAETAWSRTCEGWNNEYAGDKYGTHFGNVSFVEANDDIPNPYKQEDA